MRPDLSAEEDLLYRLVVGLSAYRESLDQQQGGLFGNADFTAKSKPITDLPTQQGMLF